MCCPDACVGACGFARIVLDCKADAFTALHNVETVFSSADIRARRRKYTAALAQRLIAMQTATLVDTAIENVLLNYLVGRTY